MPLHKSGFEGKMYMRSRILSLLSLFLVAVSILPGQQRITKTRSSISWYGTWASAVKAGKETGRPILLVAAAPHCHQVSGMW
jgi:hypothetical protein